MILNTDLSQDLTETPLENTEITTEQNIPSDIDKRFLSMKEELLCWGEY